MVPSKKGKAVYTDQYVVRKKGHWTESRKKLGCTGLTHIVDKGLYLKGKGKMSKSLKQNLMSLDYLKYFSDFFVMN